MLIRDTLALRVEVQVFVNRRRYRSAAARRSAPLRIHGDSRAQGRTAEISFKYAYRIRIALSGNVRGEEREREKSYARGDGKADCATLNASCS